MHRTVLAACLLLAACTSSSNGAPPASSAPKTSTHPPAPKTVRVAGTMSLPGGGYVGNGFKDGGRCYGNQGYDDIDAGAQVTISDDSGRTLAITQLRGGRVSELECVFKFRATVPAGKRFYGIEVTHRGVIKEPESKLGHVALTLG